MASRPIRVAVVCEGQTVEGWIAYNISDSMIEPAGSFSLTRPFSNDAWRVLRRDAKIIVHFDTTRVITGLIDERKKSDGGIMRISGRCFAGRLVQESAPSMTYESLTLIEAVKRLAYPFVTKVTLSDARNRSLKRGKGRRVPAGDEPLTVSIPVPSRGKVHPGMARWAIIEDLVSQAGYIAWISADGSEIFVGKPNYTQAAQFLFCRARPGSPNRTTVKTMVLTESNADRYSLIAVVGTGGGDDANYGANAAHSGRALDFDSADGTGRDFIYPKRLLMPERDFDSNKDGRRVAEKEMARRDFRRTQLEIGTTDHGQFIGTTAPTIYATNTIARCIDEDFDPLMDEEFMIYSVAFEGSKDVQSTSMELVPSGTEIIL